MTYDEYVGAATNAQVDIMEADLTKLRNDWTKDKDGGGYKSYIGGQPGEDAVGGGSVLDTDRGELEDFFGKLISEAKNRGSGWRLRGKAAASLNRSEEQRTKRIRFIRDRCC